MYLDDVAPSGIVGELVTFSPKDNGYIVSSTDEKLDDDIDFIALCDQTAVGWIKYDPEGGPPTKIMGLLYDNFVMPPREELGDNDETKWLPGLDGQPDDPWKHQILLVLQRGDTAALYTFSTQSKTGRRAVGNLLRHYDRMRKTHPDELPVVRLKVGGFNHRDERIGWVLTPTFAVAGRAPKDSVATPDTSREADFDDKLPY
jgi:hypothetical protein